MRRQNRSRTGFTLIELMAVVLLLAILAAVALPKFFDYRGEAQLSACKGTLGGVRAGIASFYANEAVVSGAESYPTLAELTDGSTMQEAIPDNPYNESNDVASATSAQAAGRTLIGGGAGWAYYDGSAGGNAVFYANTDTSGVNENSF
jgi:MSHA pilin protein MshA